MLCLFACGGNDFSLRAKSPKNKPSQGAHVIEVPASERYDSAPFLGRLLGGMQEPGGEDEKVYSTPPQPRSLDPIREGDRKVATLNTHAATVASVLQVRFQEVSAGQRKVRQDGKQHFDSLSEEQQLSRLKSDANFARLSEKMDEFRDVLGGQQQQAAEEKRHHQAEYHKKAQQSLRDYYNKHYAHIKAAFDKDQWPIDKSYVQLAIVRRRQVREEECKELGQSEPQRQQLVAAYESIHGLKTSVDLFKLFDKRKKTRGKEETATRTVLLVGRAGVGKTTLCHKIAHLWANGKWYKDKFEAVYVLPVRKLKKSIYTGRCEKTQEDLETAIARECFDAHNRLSESAFKELKGHITQQLEERPAKVLIVLDGLDERSGASDVIINQAKHREGNIHRLLVSRPYGVDVER
ncbi:MAG: NACHT domain-containing protein, partial [Bacteroidota bacterium]